MTLRDLRFDLLLDLDTKAFYKTQACSSNAHTALSAMDIDIDWCLTCEKRVEGDSPYCSIECQSRAGPSSYNYPPEETTDYPDDDDDEDDVIFHTIDTPSRWTGNDNAGIAAWAAEVPCGAPAGANSSSWDDSSFFSPPQGSTYRQPPPPNLLRPQRRTLPPTLSMASPPSTLPPPSHPVVTPKRQPSFSSIALTGNASMGQTSLRSAATGSSLVATPYSSQPVRIASASRKPSVLDGMYSHVRSWVSPAPPPVSAQRRPHIPVLRVDPRKFSSQAPSDTLVNVVYSPPSSCAVSEKSAIYWTTNTLVLDPLSEKQSHDHTLRGRKPATELPFRHDDHPSFRTRGRKASRAAA